MSTARRILFTCFVTVALATGPVPIALAAEAIMLRAGNATGPNAVFAFDENAKSRRIVVRTTQASVVGSRIEVFVDRSKRPALRHVFTGTECKFGSDGSTCRLIVPASSPAYSVILTAFKLGRVARITVDDTGTMKMDETVSLKGFTKRLRSWNRRRSSKASLGRCLELAFRSHMPAVL
jgi:hypothetical protein